MRKGILYIDKLDHISLPVTLICKPFFKKVYFHNAIEAFQSKKIQKRLSKLGIDWINYHNIPVKVWCNAFALNKKLSELAFDKLLKKSPFYLEIIRALKFNNSGIDKLNATIKRKLLSNWINEGTTSFALIEYCFKDSGIKIVYLPSTFGNFILGKVFSPVNTKISGVHCILSSFIGLQSKALLLIFKGVSSLKSRFLGIFSFSFSKTNSLKHTQKSNDGYFDKNDCKIAFFPHQGLTYGSFFRKTYLYENDLDSIFFKKKLLTVFEFETDKITKRFLSINKIPHANLGNILSKKDYFRLFILVIKFVKFRLLLRSISTLTKIVCSFYLCIIYLKINIFQLKLNHYKGLLVAYYHYDILVPNEMLLACHINSIRTVSCQERAISHIWEYGLIYDDYFVAGEGFIDRMQNRGYLIGKYYLVGMPRSSYITLPTYANRYKKYLEIKKTRKLIVCFDLPPLSDFKVGVESETPSPRVIFNFYDAILKLAKDFPNYYFVVKPKSDSIFNHDIVKQLQSQIRKCKNFEIVRDIKNISPYSMAYLADAIIGKHTSIMEEAFFAEKKVIYFDSEEYLKNCGYILNEIDIVEKDYEGLKRKLASIADNSYLDKNQFENYCQKYYWSSQQLNGYKAIKENLKAIYKEAEKNDEKNTCYSCTS